MQLQIAAEQKKKVATSLNTCINKNLTSSVLLPPAISKRAAGPNMHLTNDNPN